MMILNIVLRLARKHAETKPRIRDPARGRRTNETLKLERLLKKKKNGCFLFAFRCLRLFIEFLFSSVLVCACQVSMQYVSSDVNCLD